MNLCLRALRLSGARRVALHGRSEWRVPRAGTHQTATCLRAWGRARPRRRTMPWYISLLPLWRSAHLSLEITRLAPLQSPARRCTAARKPQRAAAQLEPHRHVPGPRRREQQQAARVAVHREMALLLSCGAAPAAARSGPALIRPPAGPLLPPRRRPARLVAVASTAASSAPSGEVASSRAHDDNGVVGGGSTNGTVSPTAKATAIETTVERVRSRVCLLVLLPRFASANT